ncbi:MAG: phosphate acetyltransferase [Rhodocyclaceae bacterium]|nr:phosphate acetyltransferase [Rhodocyclaceae bacterium]
MKALNRIIDQARATPRRIALSEGEDTRVLAAAARATREGIAQVTLVGSRSAIEAAAAREGIALDGIDIFDPATRAAMPGLAQRLHDLRRDKGMGPAQAASAAADPLVCANLLVAAGLVDGTVNGAVRTTADVVRTAIQIIGTRPGFKLVSSFFLMMLCEPFHSLKGGLIFSDCGLVVNPDAGELAEIAMAASDSARDLLMEEPRVAMLSFSTSRSARHAAVDKVVEAARLVKARRPALAIDEDVQLDAAIVAEIANRKLPDSRVKGTANVLIFPNLEAGNIGYKLAERVGGAVAIGPLLQGLARPANDLSRGCSADDVFHVIAVTVVQSLTVTSGEANSAGA